MLKCIILESHDVGGKFNLSTAVYSYHFWPTHCAINRRCGLALHVKHRIRVFMGFSAVVFPCLEYLWHSIHSQQEFELLFFLWSSASVQIGSKGRTRVWIGNNLEVATVLSRYMRHSPGTEKRTELPKSCQFVTKIQIEATNHVLQNIPQCSVDNVAFY
jgi:hypothetical protein